MKKKSFHDILFKAIYSQKKYSLDIFRLILSKKEYELFNWETLKSQATVLLDDLKVRQADLIFDVELKTRESMQIIFLLEHKSGPSRNVLQQLLQYQTRLYAFQKNPIIPILVYHGNSIWRKPLNFQDSLKGIKGAVKDNFGEGILNFKCRFLDIRDVEGWDGKELTTLPIFFIMEKIWNVKEKTVEILVRHLIQCGKEDRKKLQKLAFAYINGHDRNRYFTWDKLAEIEARVLKKGDRIMPPLKYAFEQELKKGIQQGREEGHQEGHQEGREEEREKMAMAMLEDHADIRMIERYTKLTRKQIETLKKKLDNS